MAQRFKTIHPFPARMAPELALEEFPDLGRPLKVLDPMTGSGTTLVAARLQGHQAVGFDRDPLAVLIARTWVTNVNGSEIASAAEVVMQKARNKAKRMTEVKAFPEHSDDETRTFMRFWFDDDNRIQLTCLSREIAEHPKGVVRDALWCALSRLIITKKAGVSLAMDVSHSRPHKKYSVAPHRALDRFKHSVEYILNHCPFKVKNDLPTAKVISADARKMPLNASSIDLIITSPPYLNAIDYMRGHKLSLVWMGHKISELSALRSTNVGTESPINRRTLPDELEQIASSICSGEPLEKRRIGMLHLYIQDLHQFMKECRRVLKSGGRAVFVLGDCNIRQTFVSNSGAVEALGELVGFKIHSTRRRPLPENRRYLPPPASAGSGPAMQKRMREEVILTMTS